MFKLHMTQAWPGHFVVEEREKLKRKMLSVRIISPCVNGLSDDNVVLGSK